MCPYMRPYMRPHMCPCTLLAPVYKLTKLRSGAIVPSNETILPSGPIITLSLHASLYVTCVLTSVRICVLIRVLMCVLAHSPQQRNHERTSRGGHCRNRRLTWPVCRPQYFPYYYAYYYAHRSLRLLRLLLLLRLLRLLRGLLA